MRAICWLHVSDLHLRVGSAWSQDVVLDAMCDRIAKQRAGGTAADFVLVTGDLAFSGKAEEYRLVAEFLEALGRAAGVPKERVFCVPGNHDIDRDRQNMCFRGARGELRDESRIDTFLAAGEELETLLKREENYRLFQTSYFTGQERAQTGDGLAYASRLTFEDVRVAIVGLDSAWLAEGGNDDHGKLLLGERQVINAIQLAQEESDPPHIVVGMTHHPLQFLCEFDRHPTQDRIEGSFQFLHCGHVHEPEARATEHDERGCLTLAAGAAFETRQSNNTYSVVTVDLLRATRRVEVLQYSPGSRAFSSGPSQEYGFQVAPMDTCSVTELAVALEAYCGDLAGRAYYFSALLLNRKAELAISAGSGHVLGSFELLQSLPEGSLERTTADFMTFRNVLRVLYKRVPLASILARHGAVVRTYGEALDELCNADPELKERLAVQERDARTLATTEPAQSSYYATVLLGELASAQDWALLQEHAQRHLDSPLPAVALQAKRMLALSLAHSDVAAKRKAVALYRSLAGNQSAESSDVGNLATLLAETGGLEEAKATVVDGIGRFPEKADYLFEIGQVIVEATGDRAFRRRMETAMAERGKRV